MSGSDNTVEWEDGEIALPRIVGENCTKGANELSLSG